MIKFTNSIHLTINKHHILGSHGEQPLLFFISTPNLMLGIMKQIKVFEL
ncbi:hypothetical protein SAMN05216364_10694 [Porphyromonadaceae bacterium KHP3R9]|jgi:hypothetical protein|nr:hypothetical protein SAMN05216364_10694 [Porphyromonadaceae bacterium KHP3R9]